MSDNYIYHPSEFQEPPVKVNSINLTFDFDISGDFVTVSAVSNYTVLTKELNSLKLNAKNLEILEITQNSKKLEYTYKDNIITLKPVRPLHYGSPFHLHAKTVCRPTKNILEGLYYDITDAGLPRTIISQCQQWGFQRITPCIDDMRAKCTWTVTIIADKRYTNIITNGNVIRERTRYDDKRDTITYQNNMPMPPYLFFIGVGTWQTFCRDFIYPSGRKIKLELLTPTGSDENYAETALDIMSDAILWTHIFTGPERYENDYERNEVYRLCRIRENLIKTEKSKPVSDEPEIASEDPLESISSQIKSASKDLIFGYTYPYEIYREIAMVNSDFGGMENTGNTTIIASRIMPDDEITDSSYEYMLGVKQHEFYHNLNGSSVTGDTPFSIWLNEAVTVMMEDDYLAFHFGHDYVRLKNILEMYTPGTGTFSLDTGIVAMPIEPDGFNDPNDLITSTTYVKAPEFTRMIEYLLGRRAFAWALDMYHSRFAGKNASPRDWLHAMEDVGRSDFSFMADRWLHQTGYPIVSVKAVYNKDEESAEITAAQTGYGDKYPWIFPLCGKFYSADGTPVCEFVKKIDAASMTFSVPCSSEFEYEAWNAGHAAYIKIVSDSTDDQLYGLLNYEKDYAVQFLAHKELFERELVRLCEDESAEPNDRITAEFVKNLTARAKRDMVGALDLTLFEYVSDKRFEFEYTKLHNAKQRVLRKVAENNKDLLKNLYSVYNNNRPAYEIDVTNLGDTFKARSVANLILSILAVLDTEEIHEMIRKHYYDAKCSSNRLNALTLYLSSSADDRREIFDAELNRCRGNAAAFENFIGAAASASSEDIVDFLRVIEQSPDFEIENAGFARAMYLRFANNRKLSLETDAGREFLKSSLLKMATVNEYLSNGILSVFSHINQYSDEIKKDLLDILYELTAKVPEEKAPSVIRTAVTLIDSAV